MKQHHEFPVVRSASIEVKDIDNTHLVSVNTIQRITVRSIFVDEKKLMKSVFEKRCRDDIIITLQ